MNNVSAIPKLGARLGDQLVIGLAKREAYPKRHKLAGRLKPQQLIVECTCGRRRAIHFHSVREGVKRCRKCYQAERAEAKKSRAYKRKEPTASSLPEVAFVTGVLLAMGRATTMARQ